MSSFILAFVVSALVTHWYLWRKRRHARIATQRAKERADWAENYCRLKMEQLQQQMQLQAVMAMYEQRKMQAENDRKRDEIDAMLREARQDGSIDSSCFEVAARKRLN